MKTVLVALTAAFALVVGAPLGAVANPGDVGFELDGNTIGSGAAPVYDWADLFDATGGRLLVPDFNPLAASAFTFDVINSSTDDIHSGGGSKDTLGIQAGPRRWTGSKPQAKDDLEHAFAGMLLIPAGQEGAGHKVLVAGVDRFDNSGDTTLGIWLLRSPLSHDDTPSGILSPFFGAHEDGDLFFTSFFSSLSPTGKPVVYRWTGDDATGTLVALATPQPAACGPAANGLLCYIVNSGPISTPWPFVNKRGATQPDAGEFTELGVDLTALFGAGNVPCFSTMLAETRSSSSPTATLSDFAIAGGFVTCDTPTIATSTAPGGSAEPQGTSQQDTATVTAPDTSTPVTGTITFFLCSPPAATDAGCLPKLGAQIGTPVTIDANGQATSDTVSGATTSAFGKYCWRAVYTPDSAAENAHLPSEGTNGTSECFTVVPPDADAPAITLTVDPADTLAPSGWYNIASSGVDGVLVHVSATDQTAVTNITCNEGTTEVLNAAGSSGSFTLHNGQHSIACTASDGINPPGAGPGSTSMPVEVDVDQTAPGLNPSVSPSPLYLHATGATASAGASDGTSGVASQSCGSVDTGTAGDHSVLCSASDNAGNSNSATFHYTVEYKILGFFLPAPNSMWKTAQSVPIKIALADVNGFRISDAEAAGLLSQLCRVKFSASGTQTLNPTCMKYDSANHQFVYTWKLGNKTGPETISVTVSYAGTDTTTTKSEQITITK